MSANSTYRLTQHLTAGGMSRNLSHLAELQPELFCEVSPELATHRGLEHGGYATITTPRGIVEACVLVPPRVHPVRIAGGLVHLIGIPFHFGTNCRVKGDSANDLVALSEEPNLRIMESKAILCNVRPGRRPRAKAALDELDAQMRRAA